MHRFLDLIRLRMTVLVPAGATMGWFIFAPAWAADAISAGSSTAASGRFVDSTQSAGVSDALARHYEQYPKWWLSGLNLVDLDGDGRLDLFLAAHAGGGSLALLN